VTGSSQLRFLSGWNPGRQVKESCRRRYAVDNPPCRRHKRMIRSGANVVQAFPRRSKTVICEEKIFWLKCRK